MNPTWQEFVIAHGKEATLRRCMAYAYSIITEEWPAAVLEDAEGTVYTNFEDLPDELPQLMGPPHDTLLFVYRDRVSLEEWGLHGSLGNNDQMELCWADDEFVITVDHDHDVSDLVERMKTALAAT
jgi:hypothetical protein